MSLLLDVCINMFHYFLVIPIWSRLVTKMENEEEYA